MSKTLYQRLDAADELLGRVQVTLGRHPGKLPPEVESNFVTLVAHRSELSAWRDLIEVRLATAAVLADLERIVDSHDSVPLGSRRVKFGHARYAAVVAHLGATWALADRVSAMVGRVLCTPQAGANAASPPQLVSHFVTRESTKKSTAAALYDSVRQSFGWPIGLSYAIRNHFVHDGAQWGGGSFFTGPTSASAFQITLDAWDRLEMVVEKTYQLDRTYHRLGPAWPATPTDDLRIVLNITDNEIDDALGVLIGSACGSLAAHVGHLLGED
jgi:hypothetical protein